MLLFSHAFSLSLKHVVRGFLPAMKVLPNKRVKSRWKLRRKLRWKLRWKLRVEA